MMSSDAKTDQAPHRASIYASVLAATEALHGAQEAGDLADVIEPVARGLGAEAALVFQAGADGAAPRPVAAWTAPGCPRTAEGAAWPEALGPSAEAAPARATCVDGIEAGRSGGGNGAANGATEGTAPAIWCPIVVDETVWGGVLFRRGADAEDAWTDAVAASVEPLARHMAGWLQRQQTQALAWGAQKDGARADLGLPEVKANQLQRRVESQRALVEASKLLVSSEHFAMEDLLRIVGDATGADYAYLLSIHPEEGAASSPRAAQSGGEQAPIDLDAYAHYEWHAPGSHPRRRSDPLSLNDPPAQVDGSTFAVPLLSSQNLLFGYLGIEFEDEDSPLNDEDVRLLHVLGDMLCTYLQRQLADQALRRSERRYRYFVGTISDAIWRVDFDPPVPLDASEDEVAAAMARQGTMAECNGELARLFGVDRAEQLIGRTVEQLTEFTGRRLLSDVMEADFRLQGQEYVIYDADRNGRYFIVNTSGVVDGGALHSVWGSTTEVTQRVQLERRMVTALEQQQQRIGRDLHDSVGQLLTGIRMLAQNIEERHFGDGSPGQAQIQKIVGYADEATRHVSNLQRGLMPVQMEQGGLAQALNELASSTDVLPDVDCIYVHDGTTDVREHEAKLQLYRIAQEATNNALKHADPSYVKIALKADGPALRIEVEDDGTGFDVDAHTEDSLGLHSMYYRARSIDATLTIRSEPGHGTTVRCELDRAALTRD